MHILSNVYEEGVSLKGGGGRRGGMGMSLMGGMEGIGRGRCIGFYPVKISYLWGDILCIVCLECCLRT